jgi:mevalonate kinase
MRRFYGKVILFGEHTIIENGQALVWPLKSISGRLLIDDKVDPSSNHHLLKFHAYLSSIQLPGGVILDLDQFKNEIDDGLRLASNAPQGYGVGSSGILTSAIFSRYYKGQQRLSMPRLKMILAEMESYFHGQSSGIDPLISFFNQPLMFNKNSIGLIDTIPEKLLSRFYLIDTNKSRSSGPQVKWVRDNLREPGFKKTFTQMCQAILPLMETFLSDDLTAFERKLKQLSHMQWQWFKPLIPDHLISMWQYGLDSDQYYMKLCGAGGGGYMLLFKKEQLPETTLNILPIT